MALTIQQLFVPQQLPAVSGPLFTMPTTPATTVLKNGRVRLTNITAAAVTATLTHGGFAFLDAASIAAHSSLDVDLPTMKAGEVLSGLAGAAASINMHEMGGALYS
jgi:hypothetical protein